MKNAILTATVVLMMIIGCTHVITRTGYKGNSDAKNDTCQVRFLRDANIDTAKGKVIGKVKVGDSGFSFACGEDDAITIFRKEACNANADIVDIIEERRPDFLSSCYRATALLIKTDSSQSSKTSLDTLAQHQAQIDKVSVEKRVKEDHQRNAMIAVMSVLLGLAIGFSTVFILSAH